MRKNATLLPLVALLVMTASWGSTFFMIKDVLLRIPATDLLFIRFGTAGLALVLMAGKQLRMSRRTLYHGIGLGLLYGMAQLLQTFGLAHTAASVSGFITGLYVVATPVLAALLLRTRISALTWLAVGLATLGLGVLSINGFSIGYGELLTLAAAIIYAVHIIAMGRWATRENTMSLTCVQMIVITVVCGLGAVPGGITLPSSGKDWTIILYLALVAGALALFLQTWAQARIEPTRAAVIMVMEPLWAAGFAVALGGETLTWRMVLGGAAILAAMYLVELAPRLRSRTAAELTAPGNRIP